MSSIQPSSFSKQFASLEITDIQLTEKILGKGSDATVKEVNWVGTSCAAKQLHEILLEDDSPGGAKRFVDNFEKECMTWSKLIHPHIVQFLGVYFLSGSRVPMLILEKMDTSLRRYLEKHTKENFVLPDKIYVLRQVAQALSYLHSRSPPLVHHDLSPNNVLLNEVSLQAKVTDFGMTRAMDPSKMTRKSSAKGTPAFMPPEALDSPPKYDEKFDVFSYGNVIVTTVIHDWPKPGPPNKYEGNKFIGVTEFQRREQYLNRFNQIEKNLFLPIVSSCLENRSHQRPSSFHLVTRMREIEESHPRGTEDSTVIPQLRHDLRLKDEQLREEDVRYQKILEESGQQWEEIKDLQKERGRHVQEITSLRKDQEALRKDRDRENSQFHQELTIKENTIYQDQQLKQKDAELRHKDEESGHQYAVLLQEHQQLQQECDQLRRERDQLQRESSHSLSTKPVSCSHLFVSFSSIKPYITTHYPFPSLNGLSYIVPPILPRLL